MAAHDSRRLDTEPPVVGAYPSRDQRAATIRDALYGVDLGAYDQRIIGRLATAGDHGTVHTINSWLDRVRTAQRLADADEIRTRLAETERQWDAMPADERGPWAVEEAYRDGIHRAVAALADSRPGSVTVDASVLARDAQRRAADTAPPEARPGGDPG